MYQIELQYCFFYLLHKTPEGLRYNRLLVYGIENGRVLPAAFVIELITVYLARFFLFFTFAQMALTRSVDSLNLSATSRALWPFWRSLYIR